jgi:hypothetical protein
MPTLTIRIKKKHDGTGSMSCVRADGSATWQRQREGLAAFFALHDLTHYAVETVLRHRLGFFGLVASGWDLEDFGSPWPRGPLPAEADPSELIVGFMDAERAADGLWSCAEFNEHAARVCETYAPGAPPPVLTPAQLAEIRARRQALFDQWEAVPAGETLVLSFDPELFK